MHFCYLLVTVDAPRRTYVGYSTDPVRRLRQHNRELVGGAKATRGRRWRHAALVGPFASRHDALSFEWHWKRGRGLAVRLARAETLLATKFVASPQGLKKRGVYVSSAR